MPALFGPDCSPQFSGRSTQWMRGSANASTTAWRVVGARVADDDQLPVRRGVWRSTVSTASRSTPLRLYVAVITDTLGTHRILPPCGTVAVTPKPASLGRDVALTLPTRVAVLALGVVTSAVIARSLGPTGRGVVATAYSLSTLLMQVGALGLTRANPYFAAREPDVRRQIVTNSWCSRSRSGRCSAPPPGSLWLIAPDALPGIGGDELALALAGVPVALASAYLRSQLLGEGRMVPYNAIELVVTAATLVVLVVALVAPDGGVIAALGVLIGGRAVAAGAPTGSRSRRPTGSGRPDRALLRRMLPFGLRVYATTVIALPRRPHRHAARQRLRRTAAGRALRVRGGARRRLSACCPR